MYNLPNNPQTITQILRNGFKFILKSFLFVYPFIVFLYLIQEGFYWLYVLGSESVKNEINLFSGSIVYTILYWILNSAFFAMILYRIASFVKEEGHHLHIANTITQGFNKTFSILLFSFMFLIMLAPLLLVTSLIYLFVQAQAITKVNATFLILLISIPYVLFVTIKYWFAPFYIVINKIGAWNAMKKSSNLTHGYFFRALLLLIIIFLISGVVLTPLFYFEFYLISLNSNRLLVSEFGNTIIGIGISAFINALATQIIYSYSFLIFKDFQVRKSLDRPQDLHI